MAMIHRRLVVLGLAVGCLSVTLLWAGVSSETPMKAIAIVPFRLPVDPDAREWLSEGLPRVLALRLQALPHVSPTALPSLPALAEEQSGHPLEGDPVAPFLERLRGQGYDVVVFGKFHQLDTVLRAEVHVWSTQPQRRLGKTIEQSPEKDPDGLGSKIASFIAASLQVNPSEPEGRRVGERYTSSPEAFERFTKALMSTDPTGTGADLERAIGLFREAVALDGKFAMALRQLADLYFRQGQYVGAAETYQAYLQQDKRNAVVYHLLGQAYFAQRDVPRAIEAYRRGLQLDGRDAQLYVDLGLAYVSQKDYENATKMLLRALEVKPDDPLAFANLGVVYLLQGNFPAATASLRRAQFLQGTNATLAYNLGLSLMFEGTYEAAREQFERALQLRPEFAAAAYQLALLAEHAEPDQAVGRWQRYIDLAAGHPGEEAWLSYAQERLMHLQRR
ncbi:MAG TPA: tetratricopeptide repeat protein [Alphaproteobacteria bacterium]|nr:tetratricopeptide repeat protein [Alphaproteobacteria bacterium]